MQAEVTIQLTEREVDFIIAMAVRGFKPTRAATEAGYAISMARDLLRRPHIRAAILNVQRNASAAVERMGQLDAKAGADDAD